jgi:hypothetical protein
MVFEPEILPHEQGGFIVDERVESFDGQFSYRRSIETGEEGGPRLRVHRGRLEAERFASLLGSASDYAWSASIWGALEGKNQRLTAFVAEASRQPDASIERRDDMIHLNVRLPDDTRIDWRFDLSKGGAIRSYEHYAKGVIRERRDVEGFHEIGANMFGSPKQAVGSGA